MNKRSGGLIAAIVVFLLVVIFLGQSTKEAPSDSAIPSPAPSQVEGAGQLPPEQQQWENDRTRLHQAIVAFEQAFGTYSYQDTAETRLARIKPYVTDEFIEEVRPSLSFDSSNHSQAFITNRLSAKAVVDPATGIFGTEAGENTACVLVVVQVWTVYPSGEETPAVNADVKRVWVKTDMGWRVKRTLGYTELC